MLRGVLASVLASVFFGVLYLYPVLLQPMNANQILAFRMLLTFPAVTLILSMTGRRWAIQRVLVLAGEKPLVGLSLLVTAGILAMQMWLFAWAPLNGYALDTSLGYFLLPLVMVVIGRVLYQEPMSWWKIAGAALATIGVIHEVWRAGGMSWPTVAVAGGYAVYFVVRHQAGTSFSGGLWAEMALMLPIAAFLLGAEDGLTAIDDQSLLIAAILGLGALSAGALVAYTVASKLLPFNVFGLLGYLEPVLLVFVSLAIGETLAPGQIFTYLPIWLALGVLVVESAVDIVRRRRSVTTPAEDYESEREPVTAGIPIVDQPLAEMTAGSHPVTAGIPLVDRHERHD